MEYHHVHTKIGSVIADILLVFSDLLMVGVSKYSITVPSSLSKYCYTDNNSFPLNKQFKEWELQENNYQDPHPKCEGLLLYIYKYALMSVDEVIKFVAKLAKKLFSTDSINF